MFKNLEQEFDNAFAGLKKAKDNLTAVKAKCTAAIEKAGTQIQIQEEQHRAKMEKFNANKKLAETVMAKTDASMAEIDRIVNPRV